MVPNESVNRATHTSIVTTSSSGVQTVTPYHDNFSDDDGDDDNNNVGNNNPPPRSRTFREDNNGTPLIDLGTNFEEPAEVEHLLIDLHTEIPNPSPAPPYSVSAPVVFSRARGDSETMATFHSGVPTPKYGSLAGSFLTDHFSANVDS